VSSADSDGVPCHVQHAAVPAEIKIVSNASVVDDRLGEAL